MIESINNIRITEYPEYVISVKHATEHRCGLKITGPRLTHHIEGTDPLKDNLPLLSARPWDINDENAVITAKVVNSASKQIFSILSEHSINIKRIEKKKSPANILLLRGAGVKLNVNKFDDVFAVKSFFIAPTAIIKG
jgi:Predicted phosphoglycerate mutase, AP superfamily